MNDNKRLCSNCGQPVERDDAYCGECGHPVSSERDDKLKLKVSQISTHAGMPDQELGPKPVSGQSEAETSEQLSETIRDTPAPVPTPEPRATKGQNDRKSGKLWLTATIVSGVLILAVIVFLMNESSDIGIIRHAFEATSDSSSIGPASDLDNGTKSRIKITNIETFYEKNASAGKVFVILGTIKNHNPYPVRFIQLEAMLYGPDDSFLTRQRAYAGNVADRKQLKSLPIHSIKLMMHTPYGHNADEVLAGGRMLPFMIVFTELPETGRPRYDISVISAAFD